MSKCHICATNCNKNTAAFSNCTTRVRQNYEHFCNEYLRLFCRKHEFDFEESKDGWVANDIGSVVSVGDLFFNMATIRTDIDHDAPEPELMKWYEYSLEVGALDLPGCNFLSWLRGCLRISETDLSRFRELSKKKEEAERIFLDSVRDYKETFKE